MKVKIENIDWWRKRAFDNLNRIDQRRAKEDAKYEAEYKVWRDRWWWRKYYAPEKAQKCMHYDGFYPSIYAWGDVERLEGIIKKLDLGLHQADYFILDNRDLEVLQ